jgi:hypothetical protein
VQAVLKFQLPEEESEFAAAQKGSLALALLGELDEWLRRKIKYEEGPADAKDAYDKVRQWLASEVEERRLPVWE